MRLTGWVGPRVLYLGDSIFADLVDARRGVHNWKTGAVLAELRSEMVAANSSAYREAVFVNHCLDATLRLLQVWGKAAPRTPARLTLLHTPRLCSTALPSFPTTCRRPCRRRVLRSLRSPSASHGCTRSGGRASHVSRTCSTRYGAHAEDPRIGGRRAPARLVMPHLPMAGARSSTPPIGSARETPRSSASRCGGTPTCT